MRKASALLPAIAALAFSCATPAPWVKHGTVALTPWRSSALGRQIAVVPSTLKVMATRMPAASMAPSVELHAARGEGESAQLLVFAGTERIASASFGASRLTGPGGYAVAPETGVLGYVPVTKPSVIGFRLPGRHPDPILPQSAFSVSAGRNQAVWYSVWVPVDAPAGDYRGSVDFVLDGRETISVPVLLVVHDVTLPTTSFLKTSINFRQENARDERYYGSAWTSALSDELPYIGLKYRFSHRVNLPLEQSLGYHPDGSLSPDWTAFDGQVEYWLSQGITCFELKTPIGWSVSPEDIDKVWGTRLAEIDRHLTERGWADLFYFYFYDEPFADEMTMMRERLDAILRHAPNIRNVLTYGVTTSGERSLRDQVGIWVPNIHQYDAAFAISRQRQGDEIWIYTCVGNVIYHYPDNFRIDWYGAAHRALGWWLFKNGIDGYLYWAVDLWRRDPWKNAATFDWTNGDGMMFYPAPDRVSQMYPSIRVHIMRDAFEDYDLLTMLRLKYASLGYFPQDVQDLLSARYVITSRDGFSLDDGLYDESHRRLLELLEPSASQ